MGGIAMIGQIDKAKVDNEVRELSRLKKKIMSLGAQRGTFQGVTLQTLAALDFFPMDRVSGPVGARTVRNAWGGSIEAGPSSFGPGSVSTPNNALFIRYNGVSSAACKQLGMQVGEIAQGVAVMDKWVKTPPMHGGTGAVVITNLIAYCEQVANNATIDFYLTK